MRHTQTTHGRPATPLRFLCILFLLAFPHARAQTDAEASNHHYRFSNAELEVVCDRMAPTTYVDGLTDGAMIAMPFAGRTYFYKSACYLALARRTVNPAWCLKVRERKTMLGDGSSHSPSSCQQLIASLRQEQALTRQSAERHAASVTGAFKIASAKASDLPGGDWLLEARTVGSLPGRYRFVVEVSRDRNILATQELVLSRDGTHRWTLPRKQVLGNTPLPAIFPVAISLTYIFPSDAQNIGKEHLTGVQNLTLSAQ